MQLDALSRCNSMTYRPHNVIRRLTDPRLTFK